MTLNRQVKFACTALGANLPLITRGATQLESSLYYQHRSSCSAFNAISPPQARPRMSRPAGVHRITRLRCMANRKIRLNKLAHSFLTATSAGRDKQGPVGKLWRLAYLQACRKWGNSHVRIRLHGLPATINFANPYPFFVREFRNYNAPQVELVARTSDALGRPVAVVDVGAAVGDSSLLLKQWCGGRISALHCIEGDEEFCALLRTNLRGPKVNIYWAVLSDKVEEVSQLVRVDHQGTATSTGADAVSATTLDRLLTSASVDVLKIDTDGFDGRILGGAARILHDFHPSVLFEWHPKACRRANTPDAEAFEHLKSAGYTRFIFFNKYGYFSHFGEEHIDELRQLCLNSSHLVDWHFDVAALHSESKVDDIALADLTFWQHCKL